jgi:hypothetical protein
MAIGSGVTDLVKFEKIFGGKINVVFDKNAAAPQCIFWPSFVHFRIKLKIELFKKTDWNS